MFELPKNRVRVISDFTGGGFGAKYGIGNFGLLAIHLSRKAGAPVRLMLDRREEHVSVGQPARQPAAAQGRRQTRRHADRDRARELRDRRRGRWRRRRLRARDALSVPQRHARSSTTSSPTPGRVRRSARRVRSRASSRSSNRSTSWPSASEWIRSRCATRSTRAARQTMPARATRERRIGAETVRLVSAAGRRTRTPGRIKRGHRHGAVALGVGDSSADDPARCGSRATARSRRSARAQDIGTGTRTILAQVVAEELGLARRRGRQPHRRHALSDRAAVGRQPGHRLADAGGAQRRLPCRARTGRAARAGARRASAEAIVFEDGHVGVPGKPTTWLTFKDAVKKAGGDEISHRGRAARRLRRLHGGRRPSSRVGKHGIGGVQFAERRRRHRDRHRSRCERIVAVHDCGRPINPKLTESQIYRRRDPGLELRALRGASPRRGDRAAAERQHRSVQDRRVARDAADRGAHARAAHRRSRRPTRAASPSRPTSPPPRRSPTRSTTPPGNASGRCR